MSHSADLYTILVSYADKNNSPYVDVDSFLDNLKKSAKTLALAYTEWRKWDDNKEREKTFWSELEELVEEKKCLRISDSSGTKVYMPHFYVRMLDMAYQDPDEDVSRAFPSEHSLNIIIPESQMVFLNSDKDLLTMMDDVIYSGIPIVKIGFSEGFGSALLLTKMLPRRMAEISLLKIREYLRHSGNKEYALRKLAVLLKCNESFLQDLMDQIIAKPMDAFAEIERGKDLASHFWAHFSFLVKTDIKKKSDITSPDIAALQAFSLIGAVSGYYRAQAAKQRDVELALKQVESNLAQPPYFYSMDQILKFKGDNGETLLGQYSGEQLEAWIKKKASDSGNFELPELFILPGTQKNVRSFVLKEKMLPLCLRLMMEAQVQVKNAIFKRWSDLLIEFKKEPAMESEKEFEKLLPKMMERHSPMLMSLLADPRLFLINEELERKAVAISAKIFTPSGLLLPWSTLLLLRRRDLLSDAKSTLPFWYHMPILSAIIYFFKNIFQGGGRSGSSRYADDDIGLLSGRSQPDDIRAAARELSHSLTPVGNTHDQYLQDLESRWCQLLDKQARENLVEDVQALARDSLRHSMKTQKNFRPTHSAVSQIAWNVVSSNPTLSTMNTKETLILYLELYVLGLLSNIR